MKLKLQVKKLIISCIIICMSWNIISPHVILASASSATDEEKGGVLFAPIQSFVVGLGDSFMELMQYALMGDKDVVYKEYAGTTNSSYLLFFERAETDWIYIPNFKISPGAIFSNQIPAFDVDFFSPMEDEEYTITDSRYENILVNLEAFITLINTANTSTDAEEAKDAQQAYKAMAGEIYDNLIDIQDIVNNNNEGTPAVTMDEATRNALSNAITQDIRGVTSFGNNITDASNFQTIYNWINSNAGGIQQEVTEERHSSAGVLRQIVSYWYNALRIIATLGLLSILVYTGIKILLSSTAADEAKYKTMLKDWLIAMCLLFFMHYFMTFTVTVVNSITDALTQLTEFSENGDETQNTEEETGVTYTGDKLMGDARIKLQQGDVSNRMTFTILYIVLVIYTFVFAVIYLKRVIYMAFLTIIAPLVAMTYPLDKMKDGKAQAFGMWMKEYVFNMILQPFHLILYYILVTTAMSLATENPIYAIIAIGFLIPAEKLLRAFFGFKNKETMGTMNAAIGGALVNQAIGTLGKERRKGGSGGYGNRNIEEGQDDFFEEPVRTMDTNFLVNALGAAAVDVNGGTIAGQNQNTNIEGGQLLNLEGIQSNNTSGTSSMIGNMPDLTLQTEQYEQWKEDLKYLEEQGLGVGDEQYDALKQQIELYEKTFQTDGNTMLQGETVQSSIDMQFSGTQGKSKNNATQKEKIHYIRGAAVTAGSFIGPSLATLTRLAAGGILGGTGLIFGVAGGLSTGDYDKAVSYGIAGTAAGYTAGSNLAKRAMDLPSNAYRKIEKASIENRQALMREIYSPEKYKEKMKDLADERFLNSKKKQEKYRRRYGRKYRKAMEDAIEYRKQGVTDDDLIMDAMDLNIRGFDRYDRVDKKKIAAAKLATGVSKEKDLTNVEKRLKELGIDPEQVDLQKAAIRELKGLY